MADHQAEEKREGPALTQSERWAKARSQALLAVDGLAENQCGVCGTYRMDGLPPVIHATDCPGRRM